MAEDKPSVFSPLGYAQHTEKLVLMEKCVLSCLSFVYVVFVYNDDKGNTHLCQYMNCCSFFFFFGGGGGLFGFVVCFCLHYLTHICWEKYLREV